MTTAVPDILARIVHRKRVQVAALNGRRNQLERLAADRADRRDFAAAIGNAPAVVAEIKKASPSKGLLISEFAPASIASAYQKGGAAALSVLTDQDFFQGSLADLGAARSACNLPVLRKDFTIDALQIVEAVAYGADAILLIAAALSDVELRHFRETAESYGIAALVEVHDRDELLRAIDSGARIVGVNNRDLRTFEVRLDTSLALASEIPATAIRVSESGIHSRTDIARLRDAGYHAFLVGEGLMRAADPEAALRDLLA